MHACILALLLEKSQHFCKICQKIKLTGGLEREGRKATLYFNQFYVHLHHQIFQSLAGAVVLVPQAPSLMLGEAFYSSENMMHSPLTELL